MRVIRHESLKMLIEKSLTAHTLLNALEQLLFQNGMTEGTTGFAMVPPVEPLAGLTAISNSQTATAFEGRGI